MVDAAVAKARELGVSENVAILDDGGNLKAFGRMDGAPIPTTEMAQNKAYTALFGEMCIRDSIQSARPRPLLSKSRKIPLVESRRLLHLKSSVIEAASVLCSRVAGYQ